MALRRRLVYAWGGMVKPSVIFEYRSVEVSGLFLWQFVFATPLYITRKASVRASVHT